MYRWAVVWEPNIQKNPRIDVLCYDIETTQDWHSNQQPWKGFWKLFVPNRNKISWFYEQCGEDYSMFSSNTVKKHEEQETQGQITCVMIMKRNRWVMHSSRVPIPAKFSKARWLLLRYWKRTGGYLGEGESQKYQNLRGQMAKYLCLPQDSGKYGQSYLKKIVETNIGGMQPIYKTGASCMWASLFWGYPSKQQLLKVLSQQSSPNKFKVGGKHYIRWTLDRE